MQEAQLGLHGLHARRRGGRRLDGVTAVLVPLSPNAEGETAGYEWYDSGIGFGIPMEDIFATLPRLKAGQATIASAVIVAGLVAAHFLLMTGPGLWVPLMLPALLVVVGHVLIITKHYLITEKAKEKSETQSAESNRMLGLALQQQGQLDMALEKFRKCPMDESMLDVFYNLALDYERKRQFNKAASVSDRSVRDPSRQRTSRRCRSMVPPPIFTSRTSGGLRSVRRNTASTRANSSFAENGLTT